MKKFSLTIFMTILVLVLAACSSSNNKGTNNTNVKEPEPTKAVEVAETPATIEVTDVHGTVTIPVNPKNVVALDNRTFETLANWGIQLAAVPKGVMTSDSIYVTDESVQDIGNHGEPNLEIIAAVNPELVLIGQRFSGYYDDIKKLVPNAAILDINIDVSKDAASPGENLVNGFKEITTTLGQIFDKNAEAAQLVADLDKSIENAKSAYNGTDKVMSVIVSGGNIGFSAPQTGRVWGPLYDVFGWVSSLEVDGSSTNHQGDEISVEAIAQSNPDWIFVLDRDAPISSVTDKVAAQDVIDNSPALQNTTAVSKGQVVYAPVDTYLNESIQTFIKIFGSIAESLAK